MATYGISFYGLSKYGTDVRTEFDVAPFTATPMDYSSVLVDWTAPRGSWDTLRLIRNRYGWSVHEDDGEVLVEETRAATQFLDSGVAGGQWLYYTIFISASGQWSRAGTTAVLMPKDNGYADLMYSLVPEYYKINVKAGNAVTDDSNTLNPYLQPFLDVFAFGFDIVKTYYDSARYTNDAMRTFFGNVQQMASQFGIDYEASAPAYLFRERVRNAATLGRERGTLEQLRSVIASTTGWDVNLSIGPNLMLSDDQADFDHPSYPQWDSAVNYAAGERAQFGAYLYQAGSSGAYGQAQAPTGTSSSNAYWTVVQNSYDSTTLVDANGHMAGWEEISFTAGVSPGTTPVQVGVGVQNPTDPTDYTGNALVVRNNNSGGVVATMGVRCVGRLSGQSSMDPVQPVLYGIPIPYAYQAWDSTVNYQPGDLVTYHGRAYRAATDSLNAQPPDIAGSSSQWLALGYDGRVQMCLSGYTQGVSGESVVVYPWVEYYDSHGSLITALYSDSLPAFNVLDSFTQSWADWSSRTTDLGGLTWTETVGQWTSSGYDGGVAYPAASGRALATLTGHADGTVAVTFVTSPSGSMKQGAVFRLQDSSNYWRAGRSALYCITSGAVSATYNYSTACSDGDRLTAAFSGSNITVSRNGTQVLSVSSSTLSTATGVGMVVE